MDPFAKSINSRLESLGTLDKDDSANVRKKIYEDGLNNALTNVLGNGIGNTFIVDQDGILRPIVIDSGILEIFFTLGWVGAILYLGAMIMLFFIGFQYTEFRGDPFMAASRAIALGSVSALPAGSSMIGSSGLFLWGFLALVMAAHKYYQHQRTTNSR